MIPVLVGHTHDTAVKVLGLPQLAFQSSELLSPPCRTTCSTRPSPSSAKRRPLVVANARHSPSCGCALRLDRTPFDALLGHARKTLSL